MFNLKFYKVGMISLLFIPAICIPYLKVEYKKRDLRLLKFNIHDPTYGEDNHFNYTALDKLLNKTTFQELDYKSSDLESAIYEFSELDSNQAFLARIPNFYHYGLKINLNNQATYNDFVHLLSIFAKYKLDRYAFDIRDDKMYILGIFNIPKSDEGIIDCGVYDNFEFYNLKKEETFFGKIGKNLENYISPVVNSFNKMMPIYFGFLAIVFVAYRKER